jgi:predicted MPP superfamily phosphohydrolase
MLLTHVKRYSLTPPNWPAGLRLHVVALADIHACRPWMTPERIRSLAERANSLQPDLIVLLGDYAAGTRLVTDWVGSSEWAPALSGLKAPLGVWSILGNHDWWEDLSAQKAGLGPTVARRALESAGIPVLENDAVRLEKTGMASGSPDLPTNLRCGRARPGAAAGSQGWTTCTARWQR